MVVQRKQGEGENKIFTVANKLRFFKKKKNNISFIVKNDLRGRELSIFLTK